MLWKILLILGTELLLISIILYQLSKYNKEETPTWFWYVAIISLSMMFAGILLSVRDTVTDETLYIN